MDAPLDAELLQIVRDRLLNDYPRQMRACLQALGDEEVWWRPNEQSNAVANLVLHVAGSNRHYLEHVIGGEDVRNRGPEFAALADTQGQLLDDSTRTSRHCRARAGYAHACPFAETTTDWLDPAPSRAFCST